MSHNLYSNDETSGLQSSVHGLHVTPSAPLPFLSGVVVRAFVLERSQGNIILYNAPGITDAARGILELGRPDRLLINHHHEGIYGAPDLDVAIFAHENDSGSTGLPIAGTFSRREKIGDDLEIIPTPGHTAGTTTFLWHNGEHHFLFPGDSIWVQGGEWKAVLLGDSDRSAYLDSLTRLMNVDFDILVPWGSEEGEPYGYAVTRTQAQERLGRISERLRAGQNA